MKIAQNPLKLIGCLREWPWLAASLFIAIAVGIYRPSIVGLLVIACGLLVIACGVLVLCRTLARLLAEQADDRLYQARIRCASKSRAYGVGRQDDHPCIYPPGWRAGPARRWAGGEAVMDAST